MFVSPAPHAVGVPLNAEVKLVIEGRQDLEDTAHGIGEPCAATALDVLLWIRASVLP